MPRLTLQVDFPTAIGVVLERDDGSTMMEIDGDKGKQGGPTYYIDTNALRVPRENMEAISPLKNGMGMNLIVNSVRGPFRYETVTDGEEIFCVGNGNGLFCKVDSVFRH